MYSYANLTGTRTSTVPRKVTPSVLVPPTRTHYSYRTVPRLSATIYSYEYYRTVRLPYLADCVPPPPPPLYEYSTVRVPPYRPTVPVMAYLANLATVEPLQRVALDRCLQYHWPSTRIPRELPPYRTIYHLVRVRVRVRSSCTVRYRYMLLCLPTILVDYTIQVKYSSRYSYSY